MSGNLEAALRAALGISEPDDDTFQQDTPDAPLALNDDDSLRAIIMGEIQQQAANTERKKQTEEALRQMIHTIQK